MRKALLAATLMLVSQVAMAGKVSGVVTDDEGRVVAGAVIDIIGANTSIHADSDGRFTLDNPSGRELELHVRAPGHMHRIYHIHDESAGLQLVLTPTVVEVINVVGLPWHASNVESAQPVSVLGDEELRRRQAANLGDTLQYQVGVHSSYYGPVASSPVIRGLDGPRVLITQNGLDAGDASRVGADHAVAAEASTARQIEILRGPSTLFYGSGAIGGVVNIVDDRVPQSNDTEGEWRLEYNPTMDDRLVSGSFTGGGGDLAVHLDGFWREAGDYRIPGPATASGQDRGSRLLNSASDAQGFNLGGSYLLDRGFVGLSVGRLERRYGIPGHSHGIEAVPVHAELEQDRLQVISELALDHPVFSGINSRFGYTDYHHDEIEEERLATTFSNKSYEGRVDIFHHPLAEWRGALTLHYKRSDFFAQGMEAFTPPSLTETWALALIEERHLGPLLLQLGARLEQTEITAGHFTARLSGYPDDLLAVYAVEQSATPFSLAAGVVWDFTPGYNLGVSFTHAQRTPSAAELLSYGPHIGSGLFEAGALLEVTADEAGGYRVDLQRTGVELETSRNLDISLRKFDGNFGFITNLFYNRIDDYYSLTNTGFHEALAHQHDDHHHFVELPLHVYQARDADLYGVEGEFIWQAGEALKLTLITDYIRARLRDGGDLPRIPPLRVGGRALYEMGAMDVELSVSRYWQQDRVAALESTTPGYTLVDLQIHYDLGPWVPGASVYLKGQNLTNEYARVHASLLKDKAPLPARSIALGISGRF